MGSAYRKLKAEKQDHGAYANTSYPGGTRSKPPVEYDAAEPDNDASEEHRQTSSSAELPVFCSPIGPTLLRIELLPEFLVRVFEVAQTRNCLDKTSVFGLCVVACLSFRCKSVVRLYTCCPFLICFRTCFSKARDALLQLCDRITVIGVLA